MKRLRLIIAREYMSIVGKKSFIVMTFLIPILIVIIGALPALIAYLNERGSDAETVLVYDQTGRFAGAIKNTEGFNFQQVPDDVMTVDDAHEMYQKNKDNAAALIVIPTNVMETQQVNIYSGNTVSMALKTHVNKCLGDSIWRAKIAAFGIPDLQEKIAQSQVNLNVNGIKLNDDGSQSQASSEVALVIGLCLAMITYMFVLMYGAMIMNSVIEEKTNRIVEVVVSSCKPFELMMGKIIGVGLVGLTQFAAWVIVLGVVGVTLGATLAGGDTAAAAGAAGTANISEAQSVIQAILSVNYGSLLTSFVLYFIGGYLLYASLFAGFGSAVDQASDASQFTTPIILIMLVALYAGIACADHPDGPMALWCSLIPFTSPVVMMVRLPYGVPFWQLSLSVVLLFATAAAGVWLSARIYRSGILRYGKKHSFKEVLKWVR